MNANYKNIVKISKDRRAKDKKNFIDSKKAKNILKWNNSISLDQGLNNTIKWYVKTLIK